MFHWLKPQDRRSAVRNVFGLFAGLVGFGVSTSQKTVEALISPDLNKYTLDKFGEQAELFKNFHVGFEQTFQGGIEYHSKKSNAPKECEKALQASFSHKTRENLLQETKDVFFERTMSTLNDREKQILTQMFQQHGSEVGELMGKVFEARRQALVQTFDRLDQDMSEFAKNFSVATDENKKA